MPISPPEGIDSTKEKVSLLLQRLGYSDDPDFIVPGTPVSAVHLRHSLETAFETMAVVGALCLRSHFADGRETATPVVYVVVAKDADEADARHRAIWSQSIVPLILVATPEYVQLRNGFDYRRGRSAAVSWSDCAAGLPPALAPLRIASLRSASGWRDFAITSHGRIDNRLHKDIRALSEWTRRQDTRLKDETNLINSLIGRFIYLYVLIDRGILDQAWIDSLRNADRPACPDILLKENGTRRTWPAEQVWALFDAIDDLLNGAIFPIVDKRHLISDATIDIVRRVLRSDRIEGGAQQLGFLDVDYASIRTETISIIYELFFELEEGSSKDDDGAFYTPPFLVDYVLDEMDGMRRFDSRSRVFDPAAGSGAFLVGAYRRVIESEREKTRRLTPAGLRATLLRCIWGMELKEQAANVARFGLYLTMLDYLPGISLRTLPRVTRSGKLFPPMENNIVHGDTFERLPDQLGSSVTHVVGNPPWAGTTKDGPALDYRERLPASRPVTRGNLAELFFWRCMDDVVAPDGIVALIMPTKSFVAPKARHFPKAMFSSVRVYGITNLAHLRRRLFADAEAPATVIFGSPKQPTSLDWTWRYSPILANQPLSKDGHPWAIVIDRGNVDRTRQIDLAASKALHRELMLQPIDRRLATDMEARTSIRDHATTFRAFAAKAGLLLRRGGSPTETGLPKHLLVDAKSNNYLERLGLSEGSRHDYDLPLELLKSLPPTYSKLFSGPLLLVARSQSRYDVIEHPLAFASTLFGIAFESADLPAARKIEVLTEIATFLRSAIGRYLLALFGRLWVLDRRRFETTDLLEMPFPFCDVDDLLAHRPSKMSDEGFTRFFQQRLDLPPTFRSIVREHHLLRVSFENGRVPPESVSSPVTDKTIRRYVAALTTNFDRLLGVADGIFVMERQKQDSSVRLILAVGGKPHTGRSEPGLDHHVPDFGEQSTITVLSRGANPVVMMNKSDAMAAWTMERAYLDAENLVRSLMSAKQA